MPVGEYVRMRENGELVDPELRFYQRSGLTIERIIPNSMDDDSESRNYGVLMVWNND